MAIVYRILSSNGLYYCCLPSGHCLAVSVYVTIYSYTYFIEKNKRIYNSGLGNAYPAICSTVV
jgi:hypothetical protein